MFNTQQDFFDCIFCIVLLNPSLSTPVTFFCYLEIAHGVPVLTVRIKLKKLSVAMTKGVYDETSHGWFFHLWSCHVVGPMTSWVPNITRVATIIIDTGQIKSCLTPTITWNGRVD